MPNFKPKSEKKIKYTKNNKITLDNKHREKMDEFLNIKEKIIPKLKKQLKIGFTTDLTDYNTFITKSLIPDSYKARSLSLIKN